MHSHLIRKSINTILCSVQQWFDEQITMHAWMVGWMDACTQRCQLSFKINKTRSKSLYLSWQAMHWVCSDIGMESAFSTMSLTTASPAAAIVAGIMTKTSKIEIKSRGKMCTACGATEMLLMHQKQTISCVNWCFRVFVSMAKCEFNVCCSIQCKREISFGNSINKWCIRNWCASC